MLRNANISFGSSDSRKSLGKLITVYMGVENNIQSS